MKKSFLILLLTFAAYCQMSSQTVNGLIVSDTNNVTVVKLWGTSEERGFAYGYLMCNKIDSAAQKCMIPYEWNDYEAVRTLIQQGNPHSHRHSLSKAISEQTGVACNTIKKYLMLFNL